MDEKRNGLTESIFDDYMSGYHRCFLDVPMHMEYVSENLCGMLGYSPSEIYEITEGMYTYLMHPEDVFKYEEFLTEYKDVERCDNIIYRLVRKDGSLVYVADTMASRKSEDGHLRGYSVLCNISETVDSIDALHLDHRSIARIKVTGISEYTIIGANEFAIECLGDALSKPSTTLLDFIVFNEREKLMDATTLALEKEYSGKVSSAFLSDEGNVLQVDYWVERITPPNKSKGNFLISFRVKEDCDEAFERNTNFERQILQQFAEDVYEVNAITNSVVCVSSVKHSPFRSPLNIRMNLEDTFDSLLRSVSEADRCSVKEYIDKMLFDSIESEVESFSKIRLSIVREDVNYNDVLLTAVPVSKGRFFLCFDYTELHEPIVKAGSFLVFKDISINLFGNFRISVNGKNIRMHSAKAKELLALLVVKKGAFLSSREAISALWEEEPTQQTRARYRKTVSRLLAELRELEIDYIIESDRGHRRIIPEYIKCDYYDYLSGEKDFNEELLSEYSWAEYLAVNERYY